jgi:hypothetical protein
MLAPACNRKKKSTLHVCKLCHVAVVTFRTALLAGDIPGAMIQARSGRIRYVRYDKP